LNFVAPSQARHTKNRRIENPGVRPGLPGRDISHPLRAGGYPDASKEISEAHFPTKELLRQNPSNPVYWNTLGIGLDPAIRIFSAGDEMLSARAVKVNPKYAMRAEQRGTSCTTFKKYGKSLRSYERALNYAQRHGAVCLYSNLCYA